MGDDEMSKEPGEAIERCIGEVRNMGELCWELPDVIKVEITTTALAELQQFRELLAAARAYQIPHGATDVTMRMLRRKQLFTALAAFDGKEPSNAE